MTTDPSPADAAPLIRYGFYAGLVIAIACLLFTIIYISFYSTSTVNAFEAHHDAYLVSMNTLSLQSVLTAKTAQNKTLLQSCGIVAGIAFGFLGFCLFLLGIQGDIEAGGKGGNYEVSLKRLTPGGLVMIAAIFLVGICAIHKIELDFKTTSPQGPSAIGPSETLSNDTQQRLGGESSHEAP